MFHSISQEELRLELLRQGRQRELEQYCHPTDILGFPMEIKSPENLELDLTQPTLKKETNKH
jgi:hypothetical protein